MAASPTVTRSGRYPKRSTRQERRLEQQGDQAPGLEDAQDLGGEDEIAVADRAHHVGDDGLLGVPRETVHEAPGHHDRGVLHREARRRDVRGRRVDEQHARRRHRGGDRDLLHQVRQPLLGQIRRAGRPHPHPAEHAADAGAPEGEPHQGPEQQRGAGAGQDEQTDQQFPRQVHVGPAKGCPHGGQQVKCAIDPGGEIGRDARDQVDQAHRHRDDGDEDR
jgi:hypothetical protein